MDDRVSNALKKLNALKHDTVTKQKQLDALTAQHNQMEKDKEEANATLSGSNKLGQTLRDVQNRSEKAEIRIKEAEKIKCTYEVIKTKLKEVSEV